jgi:phospholipid transport system substrate-binding protein
MVAKANTTLRVAGVALALLLLGSGPAGVALAAPTPAPVPVTSPAAPGPRGPASTVIDALDNTLLSVMKQADQLGYDGRYKKLESAIKRAFNIPLMTRIIVGTPWNDWTEEQRNQIGEAFGKFVTATYARRFDGYSGENFVIDGEKPAAGGVLVMTRLIRPTDPPVTLNYLMRDTENGPQIVDVFLTGTISELATRRSEFTAVLQRDGFPGLLATLERKTAAQAAGDQSQ